MGLFGLIFFENVSIGGAVFFKRLELYQVLSAHICAEDSPITIIAEFLGYSKSMSKIKKNKILLV